MFKADVVSVMIASPGDVTRERQLVRDILHDYNDLHARANNCVLLPVGWETHAAPDLGGRPQEIINKAVLEYCDILVGVFWTRIGSPTGVEESGTVEEIKRHIESGKPAMVYFSSAPVVYESVDRKQYDALLAFRDWCKERGLVQFYDDHTQFAERFRNHILMVVRDNPIINQGRQAAHDPAPVAQPKFEEQISAEAKLLVEKSAATRGEILCMNFIGGRSIQVGGENLIDGADRRIIAKWEAAMEELEVLGLIVARGHKREFFELTAKGYEVADALRQIQ